MMTIATMGADVRGRGVAVGVKVPEKRTPEDGERQASDEAKECL